MDVIPEIVYEVEMKKIEKKDENRSSWWKGFIEGEVKVAKLASRDEYRLQNTMTVTVRGKNHQERKFMMETIIYEIDQASSNYPGVQYHEFLSKEEEKDFKKASKQVTTRSINSFYS